MKNISKARIAPLFRIIALVAVIGFSFAACSDGGGGGDGGGTKGGLTAPKGFTATAYSSSSIILSWNAVPGATGYNVYNGTSSSALSGPGTVTSNYALNYSLPANTTVYYQIAAYNANGEGPRSTVVSATTLSANTYLLTSLNGTWEWIGNGRVITISGNKGVFNRFENPVPALWQSAIDKGYVTIGSTSSWQNLTSTGNLTWSGQLLAVRYNTSNPNVAIGTAWQNCTFSLSSNGQTLTCTANDGSTSTWTRK
jgi:hypothetical protein